MAFQATFFEKGDVPECQMNKIFKLGPPKKITTKYLPYYTFFILIILKRQMYPQGFIQAILMFGKQHKKLNLATEFSNLILIKKFFKAY